jgi:polyferredoxin
VVGLSLLVFILLFLSAFFFGRLWCGYICPLGGLQDLASSVWDRPVVGGRLHLVKYAVAAVWLLFVAWAFLSAGGIREVSLSYSMGLFAGGLGPYVVYYFFVGVFVLFPMFFGRRAGCRCICWLAPFLILARKIRNFVGWPSLHLSADKSRCGHCLLCKAACSMGLEIYSRVQVDDMEHPECILCGRCVRACPQRVIKYAFGGRKRS